MPVDKQKVAEYVAELGLPQDKTEELITTIMGSEKAATQFVGQRLRHDDYTTKTQSVAQQKAEMERGVQAALTEYAQKMQEADDRVTRIMTDLENEKISRATADARLAKVKEVYKLSDDDIPDTKPAAVAKNDDKGLDMNKLLADFETRIVGRLQGDLLSLPKIAAVQSDIQEQHFALTGKRLSLAEMNELLELAPKQRTTLAKAWESKYNIPEIRYKKDVEAEVAKRIQEEEAKRRAKASEDALAGVRRVEPTQPSNSPVIGRKFDSRGESPAQPAGGQAQNQNQNQNQNQVRLSGAERAAAKYIERRNAGIPMGAPATPAST